MVIYLHIDIMCTKIFTEFFLYLLSIFFHRLLRLKQVLKFSFSTGLDLFFGCVTDIILDFLRLYTKIEKQFACIKSCVNKEARYYVFLPGQHFQCKPEFYIGEVRM